MAAGSANVGDNILGFFCHKISEFAYIAAAAAARPLSPGI
jgi:hypothetical protein